MGQGLVFHGCGTSSGGCRQLLPTSQHSQGCSNILQWEELEANPARQLGTPSLHCLPYPCTEHGLARLDPESI